MSEEGKKYESWVESKFQGLTKEQLRDAGKFFGVTFGPGTAEATMRIKLCQKVGQEPPKEPEKVIPLPVGKRPNLTAKGKWEGKRIRCILRRNDQEKNHKNRVIKWEQEARYFPFDEVVDMPWPWYNVMNDAKSAHFTQKKQLDEEGNLISMSFHQTPTDVNPHTYVGVTPGTEDLPGDLQEYWTREAKRTNYFANYKRPSLLKIHSEFVGAKPAKEYADVTNEDIRFDILRHCNLENAILELEAEAEQQERLAA